MKTPKKTATVTTRKTGAHKPARPGTNSSTRHATRQRSGNNGPQQGSH